MKKFVTLGAIAMAAVMGGTLISCQDEDFGVSSTELKEKAFQKRFADEFGEPAADQRWDFYGQLVESLNNGAGVTRASGDTHEYVVNGTTFTLTENAKGVAILSNDNRSCYNNTIKPTYNAAVAQHDLNQTIIDEWKNALPEHNIGQSSGTADNTGKGISGYTLQTPSTGLFTVSAVSYNGYYNRFATQQRFEFGIELPDGTRYRLFGGGGRVKEATTLTTTNQWGRKTTTEYEVGEAINIWSSPANSNFNPEVDYFGSWTDADAEGATPNPLWASYVYLNPEKIEKFKFYYTYYDSGNYGHDSEEDGRSMLLYSAETDTKRVMMIGFEDCKETGSSVQTDINDFIIYLQGDLPVPTSKRFLCEDLESLDWDYNDVVFDVSNTGVTLRAVGGTLPVWLEINGSMTEELHELMHSKQTDPAMQGRDKIYTKDGKTYYMPINTGDGKHGIKLDPVKFLTWSGDNRLTDEQLTAWSSVKLYVGTEYGQTTGTELAKVKDVTKIGYDPEAKYPSIIEVPYSVSWMKDLKKITKGYPTFYKGNNPDVTPQAEENLWYNYGKVAGNLYTFSGDNE